MFIQVVNIRRNTRACAVHTNSSVNNIYTTSARNVVLYAHHHINVSQYVNHAGKCASDALHTKRYRFWGIWNGHRELQVVVSEKRG